MNGKRTYDTRVVFAFGGFVRWNSHRGANRIPVRLLVWSYYSGATY